MHLYSLLPNRKVIFTILILTIFGISSFAQTWEKYDKQCDGRIRFTIHFYGSGTILVSSDVNNPSLVQYKNSAGNWVTFFSIYFSGGYGYGTTYSNAIDESPSNSVNIYNIAFNVQEAYNVPIDFRFTAGGTGTYTGTSYGPNSPSNLAASVDQYCDKVSLTWTNPTMTNLETNCTGTTWEVQVLRDGNYIGTGGKSGAFDDLNAYKGYNHTYTLRAHATSKNASQTSFNDTYSPATAGVTGRRIGAMGVPTAFAGTTNQCDNVKLTWTWTGNNPSAFTIYRSTSVYGNFVSLAEPSGTDRQYLDQPSDRGVTYYYKIASKNTCGDLSSFTSAVTGQRYVIPPAPSNITASTVNGKIKIDWTDNSTNEDGFRIVRTSVAQGTQQTTNVGKGIITYTDPDAVLCQNYKYEVLALDPCQSTNNSGGFVYKMIGPDLSNFFLAKALKVSKGYYSDKVMLSWTTNMNARLVNTYKISRRLAGTNDPFVLINSMASGATIWQDNYADAGVLYEYSLGAEGTCDTSTIVSNVITDIGFRTPSGIVSGHIDYEGGVAVENVNVLVAKISGSNGTALALNGTSNYVTVPNKTQLNPTNISIQMWVKPASLTADATLLNKSNGNNGYFLKYSKATNTTVFSIYNGSAFVSASCKDSLKVGTFTQLTGTYDGAFVRLYVNGQLADSAASTIAITSNTASLIFGCANNQTNFFNGTIDEIRLWSTALSSKIVARDFSRIMSGEETGLIGYWRADENTGVNLFDASKTGSLFNENHADIMGPVNWTNIVPTNEQLGLKGITDVNGNYIINNIRYTGSGNNFTLTPYIGQHTFSPSSSVLFIGEGASVHNNQNFKDISSFKVTGTVQYKNTSCYSNDVYVYIDGQQVIKNGQAIKTDASGFFEINVPIGYHSVSVGKNGHGFSPGIFPPNPNVKQNFLAPLSGLVFKDTTLINVIGRVVGGTREGNKKAGFGKSVNNIGTARITFESQQGNGCKKDTVYTNDLTGEYKIALPPMKYIVSSVTIPKDLGINFGTLAPLDLTPVRPLTTSFDTVRLPKSTVISRIDSIHYHIKNDYIYRVNPEINVANSNGSALSGDSLLSYKDNKTNVISTVNLNASPFDFPVYTSGTTYKAHISVFERYVHPVTKLEDKVPVTDAKLTLHNGLSNMDQEIINLSGGDTTYAFLGGQPNVLADVNNPGNSFTKNFLVTVETGSKTTEWKPNGNYYRAYVFGAKSDGNNFATNGPQLVDAILRDPPGSGSSAYIGQGTSQSTYEHWTTDLGTTVNFEKDIMLGTEFTIGLGYTTRTKLQNTLKLGLAVNSHGSFGGGLENTWTADQKIATSSSPAQAGAASDLYIGKSTNFIYGSTTNLLILPDSVCAHSNVSCYGKSNSGFQIGKRMGMFAVPGGFETMFIYTQDHIENYLIPNLVKLRNSLFSKHNYISKLPPTNANFGTSNDDPIWGAAATSGDWLKSDPADYDGPSYKCDTVGTHSRQDSVRWYNQQIRLWRDAMAQNEKEKFTAENNKNISFTSGSTTSYDYTSSKNETTTNTFEIVIDETLALKIAAEIGGVGVEAVQSLVINQTHNKDWGSSSQTSNSYGYTLNDPEAGDFFSVDVKKVTTGNGPVFKTIGGQSSCPWEEKVVAKYPWKKLVGGEWKGAYDATKIGTTLSEATQRREIPVLKVTPFEIFNVPENGAAVFNLSLGNASASGDMMWYRLGLVESSNPRGAKLSIDGSSVSRVFDIPAGATINKQLTISKGPVDNDYTNIKLILYSQCEYDNFMNGGNLRAIDTISVSVHFVPACSAINFILPTDQWVVNSSNHDTLNLVVGGYDRNFPSLKSFQVEYKPATSATWIALQKFTKDTAGLKDKTLVPIPTTNPYTLYAWDMSQMIDGKYNIRATTHCPLAESSSQILTGIVDRVNPHPFGSPQPADGVLSPNDELSIQFNEKINEGMLTWNNFDIRGVLNGTKLNNGTSVKFDGIDKYAKIPDGINLSSKSFSTEFWLKRNATGEQCVLSQGNDATSGLYIGFDAGNKFFINLAGNVVASTAAYTDTDWHHYAVSFNNMTQVMQLFYDGAMVKNAGIVVDYTSAGDISMAKSKFGAARFLNGNIHEMRIWNTVRSQSNIVANMNVQLTGKESGLLGNWRMDEAHGTLLEDRVHHRNGTMYADWQVDPTGRSFDFSAANSYLEMDGSKLAFTKEMDFTIEFWYKGISGNNVCLFSNGKGDGTDANTSGWTINTDASGQIMVNNKGLTFNAVSKNTFDNNWHHFALVVRRSGNTSAYLDGDLQNTQSSSQWLDFGGAKLWLASRGWYTGVVVSHDQHFSGKLDEVRVWNLAKKQDQILLDMNSRLSGDEFGLMAYLPFENYQVVVGVNQLTETLADQSNNTNTAKAFNGGVYSLATPNIKLKRPVEKVNFTYSVNQDKIIFTPTDLPNRIENCILSITVKDVVDMNGNLLQSPETWTAYIDKNQVKWNDQQVELQKLLYAPLSFTKTITNSGGAQQAYSITNLPPWLTASPQSGTLQPLSSQDITFTVNQGLNIGNYGQDIYLHTNFDFDEKLLLNLKVYEKAPVWKIDPSKYLYSMNVIGQLSIDSIYSTNSNDIVAAFVGNELRGVANVEYIADHDIYRVFMSIYSNVQSGEVVKFIVWNANEGKTHINVTPVPNFVMNDLIGSLNSPVRINATNALLSYIPLKTGWNWTSFNLVSPALSNTNKLLTNVSATTGNLLKGKDSFDGYDAAYGWTGSVSSTGGVKNESMYKILVNHNDTIKYTGQTINPLNKSIAISTGWNWIGYLPAVNMEINDAFGKYNPSIGDVVKSQYSFAVYDPTLGWVGNLKYLVPTEGYMLYANNSGTLTYPKEGLFSSHKTDGNAPVITESINHQQYQYNMSVIATVNSTVPIADEDLLKAYAGKECRGIAYPQSFNESGKKVFFLAIDGNNQKEVLNFKLVKNGKEYSLVENMQFLSNNIVGTIYEPYPLTFADEAASINSESAFTGTVYPNPFKQGVTIALNLTKEDYLDVKVYDILHREIYIAHYNAIPKGAQKIHWSGSDQNNDEIPSGVYLIELTTSAGKIYTKVAKTE